MQCIYLFVCLFVLLIHKLGLCSVSCFAQQSKGLTAALIQKQLTPDGSHIFETASKWQEHITTCRSSVAKKFQGLIKAAKTSTNVKVSDALTQI